MEEEVKKARKEIEEVEGQLHAGLCSSRSLKEHQRTFGEA